MLNPLSLAGQRILVTGAASGIGFAVCRLLGELGASVVALDRDDAGLDHLLAGCPGSGHVAHCIDLSATDAIPACMINLAQCGGPLSGVVHAAGIHSVSSTRLLTSERYREVLSVNAEAALALLRGFQNRKVCRDTGGSVVFISSVVGMVGSAGSAAYAMSKAALTGLTKSAALEFAPRKIRINCVAPGFVKTQMYDRVSTMWTDEQRQQVEAAHPLGLGETTDVANAVAFLLADTARWVTGTVLVCDGGYTAS